MTETNDRETCDVFATELSAFLDGELAFPDALPAVDHLASCAECRAFYLEARGLSEKLISAAAPEAPEKVWRELEVRAGAPGTFRRATPRRRFLAAAALAAAALAVVFGLAQRRAANPPPIAAGDGPVREIVVAGSPGRMTDERYVALLAEILSADKKYHRETERVIRLVLGREKASEPDERDAPRTEDEAGERGGPAETPRISS